MPPDLRDWLPEHHLAYYMSDLVNGLDLTAFSAPYEGDGRRNMPYGPRMMVKLLFYGYVVLGPGGNIPTKTGDPKRAPATKRLAEKLVSETGRATYTTRKWISEAPHGWIKEC